MDTEKEMNSGKKVFLILFIALLTFAIELASAASSMAFLPVKSYAARSMITIILCMVIFLGCLLSAISLFESLNKSSVWRLVIFIGIAICIMMAFSFVSFHWIPVMRAKFSYISYRYFVQVDKIEDAEASINEALNSDQQNDLYWMESGRICVKKEDYRKSIYYFSKALEWNQNSDKLLFARGCAYQKAGDLDAAKQDLEAVVEHCPNNAEYNYELARVYVLYGLRFDKENKDNFEQALNYFTEAINLSSKNKDYYYWRACTYLWLETKQDYLKAIDDFTTAIRFQVDNANYYYWRGRAYTYLNDYSRFENAISDFTEAIKIDNANADYYWWRGMAYYGSEQYQNSINDYDRAIRQKPDDARYYYWKAKAYRKLEDFVREQEAICKAIECNESEASYHYYLGALYYNKKDYDNAVAEFMLSVDYAPDTARYYFDLGDAYYMSKQYREAIEAYSKAIEIDDTESLYWARRGFCYFLIDEIDSMKADMISAMKMMEHGKEIFVD